MRQIVIPIIVVLVSPWFLAGMVRAQDSSGNLDPESMTAPFFLRALGDGAMDFEYFLAEIEIVDDQGDQLMEIVRSYRREQVHAYERLFNAESQLEKAVTASEVELLTEMIEREQKRIAELPATAMSDVEDVLLPHQLSRIKQALVVRHMLRAANLELFEFPLLVSKRLELSEQEVEILTESIEQEKAKFLEQRERLLAEAWDEIVEEIPSEVLVEARQEIGEYFDLEKARAAQKTIEESR